MNTHGHECREAGPEVGLRRGAAAGSGGSRGRGGTVWAALLAAVVVGVALSGVPEVVRRTVRGGPVPGPALGGRTPEARPRFGALSAAGMARMSGLAGQVAPQGGRGARTRGAAGPGAGGGFRQRGDPRAGVPEWSLDEAFRDDAFSFVRLQYRSSGRGGWRVDYPGADLNLSYRLHRLSSLRVSPDPLALELDDPRLFDYPFLFMTDPRSMALTRSDAEILRRYLLGGGFLLVDDFWGKRMWDHLMSEMAKVFPDREPVSLPFEHSIFHVPYHLPYKPQVPSEDSAHATKDQPDPYRTWEFEITWEEPHPVEYRAYLDDRGRVMMLIGWNTDLSDGWEEEGISEWFFKEYSEKLAYPMGINIVFYAMTH